MSFIACLFPIWQLVSKIALLFSFTFVFFWGIYMNYVLFCLIRGVLLLLLRVYNIIISLYYFFKHRYSISDQFSETLKWLSDSLKEKRKDFYPKFTVFSLGMHLNSGNKLPQISDISRESKHSFCKCLWQVCPSWFLLRKIYVDGDRKCKLYSSCLVA